ncbi:unnamed protein product, partial [Amoebophrya sp. A120]
CLGYRYHLLRKKRKDLEDKFNKDNEIESESSEGEEETETAASVGPTEIRVANSSSQHLIRVLF